MADPAFFPAKRVISVNEIAELTGASIADPALADRVIHCVASIDDAPDDALVYLDGESAKSIPAGLKAAAIICLPTTSPSVPPGVAALLSKSPRLAFAKVAQQLYSTQPVSSDAGISPGAHIHEQADIEDDVTIGAGAVIARGAQIGRGSVIGPNTVIGANCKVGRECQIGSGCGIIATLMGDRVVVHGGAQIGADGFGFVPGVKYHEKVPQLGRVIIQDDVEIGANTTIDRGAITDTVVGAGTKIDNLVQIGHNTKVGRNCLIAAQTGISGTVVLGDQVMLGGQVGIRDHVTIASGVQVGGKSGVVSSIRKSGRWFGNPARPMNEAVATLMAMRRLFRQVRKDKQNV